MKVNEKLASGIVITGEDIMYAKAFKKPNANTQIIQEIWFKGTVKKSKELLNKLKKEEIEK